jgi:hypothetical protein
VADGGWCVLLLSSWPPLGQLFDDVHYRFPNVLNSDLCLTTYTAFPYARRQADDATAAAGGGGGGGDGDGTYYHPSPRGEGLA